MISAIVAINHDNVISVDGTIPWHSKGDMEHFKETTSGHVVIMGRKTYESIGKPLPNRINIVLTRSDLIYSQPRKSGTRIIVMSDLDEAIKLAKENYPDKEIFIIGGQTIYEQSLKYCDELIVTTIDWPVEDNGTLAYFPNISDIPEVWESYKSFYIKDNHDPHTITYYKRRLVCNG